MYIVSAFLGCKLIDPLVFSDELNAYKKWACIALETAWDLDYINKKTFDKTMNSIKNLTDVTSIRALVMEILGFKNLTDTCTLYDYEDVYMVKVSSSYGENIKVSSYTENQKGENNVYNNKLLWKRSLTAFSH